MTSSRIRPIAREILHKARRLRGRISVGIGRSGSLRPLSTAYGFDRGTPIDRFYVERFLEAHAADIRGRVLEIGDSAYSERFGGPRVDKVDVLHIDRSNPAATIVGDLAQSGVLPTASFDCIILTQTLQYVIDLPAAISNIRAALRPGGVALITVPSIAPQCEDEWKKSHYWLFTVLGLQRLLSDGFGDGNVAVDGFGNLYAATAFLHCAAVEEVSKSKLKIVDTTYPITIAARAVA